MHALTKPVNLLRRLAPSVFQRITQEASMSSKLYPYPCWQQGMGLENIHVFLEDVWKTLGRRGHLSRFGLEDVNLSNEKKIII